MRSGPDFELPAPSKGLEDWDEAEPGNPFRTTQRYQRVINLHPPSGASKRGRFRAEYVLSEMSSQQEKFAAVFEIRQLAHQ